MPDDLNPKRKASDAPVSPPAVKRKVQSGTTKTAIANFFTPASQKPKDPTVWSERSPNNNDDIPATLLVGRFEPEKKEDRTIKRRKIAAFDLDSTLIATSSGKKHASSGTDWKWWHNSVPDKLRELYHDGFRVVILSNQAGLTLHFDAKYKGPKGNAQKRVTEFKQKCSAVLNSLNLPTCVYAATEHDIYRKPRTGMWKEVCDDYDISETDVDLENSIFVGDAGGRTATFSRGPEGTPATAKDFSCSDRNFAHNVGIKYRTPEEFFLGDKARSFAREFDLAEHPFRNDAQSGHSVVTFEKTNDKDMILFCGPPGAGKSTFYWKSLKPLGYERINQDLLKTRDKCVQAAAKYLQDGKSIAIDNTNADPETRTVWVELAKKTGISIRCVWFKTPLQVCEHNNAVRALNESLNPESRSVLPKMAFTGFASRFKPPQLKEGFQDITEVQFQFRGTEDEYQIWGRYWT
ncbi:polynucleotide kinase 3 phosphatase-domain-containing protein [Fusarium tricinctum]|uniref:Polynucleotide kinase 3 phosphatase-domain-containing protein n=1 Tax=Fusarium tricinctum TaxID=61284 RepID=A0A8K0S7R8_9HYPO|nr:polynucleotide kinase 3 phosphatase-domain-containing protein [Fusarium tricinctum]